MTDLGLYNFIKGELAKGKSREEISATLAANGGWTQTDLDQAFSDVRSNNQPIPTINSATQTLEVKQVKSSNKLKIFIAIILLGVVGFILVPKFLSKTSGPGATPTEAEVIPLVGPYVSSQEKDCIVTRVAGVKIGKYEASTGGRPVNAWPVYASYEEECRTDVGATVTYDYLDAMEKNNLLAYVRRSGGKLELFMPEYIKKMFDDMTKDIQNSFQ